MQKRFNDPGGSNTTGPESGEARSTFDDIDDYKDYSESPPVDSTGLPIPGFAGWTRTAKVTYVSGTNLATSANNTGIFRIIVTATSPAGQSTTLTGLRSSESGYERVQGTQTTYITQTNMTLQVGTDDGSKIVTSVNPVNQVP